jgi:hypothetical protein
MWAFFSLLSPKNLHVGSPFKVNHYLKDWLEMYGLCDRIKAEAPINTPLAERLTCRLEAMMSEAGYIE